MKTNPLVLAEGSLKGARYAGKNATRGQKETEVFLWDVALSTDDNFSRYKNEPLVKIHRWWGGHEKSLEYGQAVTPMPAYLSKHLKAAKDTGALLILNRKFVEVCPGAHKAAFLIDTGVGMYLSDAGDIIEDSQPGNVGWHGEFANRVYLLTEEQADLLEAKVGKSYNKSKAEAPDLSDLNWPFAEKSD